MSPGDHQAMVAGVSAAIVALALFGLIVVLVWRQAEQMRRRFSRIEALITEARSAAPDPYRRLDKAATEALAAYRAIFSTCWNDRDRRAFGELEAALEEVRSRTAPPVAPGS